MPVHSAPPRHTASPGAHWGSAAGKPLNLRFTREDFERTIEFLPREKQDYARRLFTKDPNSRFMHADETKLRAFMENLKPEERDALQKVARAQGMYIRPENPSGAKPKFGGRSTPEPGAYQARRPAKGEDLHTPFSFHAEGPQQAPRPTREAAPPHAPGSKPTNAADKTDHPSSTGTEAHSKPSDQGGPDSKFGVAREIWDSLGTRRKVALAVMGVLGLGFLMTKVDGEPQPQQNNPG